MTNGGMKESQLEWTLGAQFVKIHKKKKTNQNTGSRPDAFANMLMVWNVMTSGDPQNRSQTLMCVSLWIMILCSHGGPQNRASDGSWVES